MPADRKLLVVADDFGIGPGTTRGILRLCRAGVVSGTVLLVNSPFAADAVKLWKQANPQADLGWHPCLTLDAPVANPETIPTIVQTNGHFFPLGSLVKRLLSGRVRYVDVLTELRAQLQLFRDLVGCDPLVVNAHHHVQVFSTIGAALQEVLTTIRPLPYLRCVREPAKTLWSIKGARCKRVFLSSLGRRQARIQQSAGFPGNDWLAGITDPPLVHDPTFFVRWLRHIPGHNVELTCHPGEHDLSLLGRDAQSGDGNLERRTQELHLLLEPSFRTALRQNGFRIISPSELLSSIDVGRIAA